MTPTPLYQAAVSELEAVLAPRVVSRSLQEGLAQTGSSPATLGFEDLERILKGGIYRHLQVTMPIERAKETVSGILERLRDLDGGAAPSRDPTPAPLDRQLSGLAELKGALKPFNLYFEWPEVQKLRSQVQLLEREQAEGNEAAVLLREAREQLEAVSQKLEDQLVGQARDLGELEGQLEQVRSLGGPKVRRLDGLLGQVREAQRQRQLAPAEIERARKLATELRKLLESSVLAERARTAAEDTGIVEIEGEEEDEERLEVVQDIEEGVTARLLMIDLESEGHELDLVEDAFRNLLEHRPRTRERFEALREELDGGVPLGERLQALREELQRESDNLRAQLDIELAEISDDAVRFREHLDVAELSRAVDVARGVLQTTLPEERDLGRVRELHAHARRIAGEARQLELEAEDDRQARLRQQAAALERLEAELKRLRRDPASETWEELRDGLAALRAAQQQQELVPELLASVRRTEGRLQAEAGSGGAGAAAGPLARLHQLEEGLGSLPLLPPVREAAAGLSARLAALGTELRRSGSAGDRWGDELDGLDREFVALRQRLREAYSQRLREARAQAGELDEPEMVRDLELAEEELADGVFPGLLELERRLRLAVDTRHRDQLAELRSLEAESARFAGLELPGLEELLRLLDEAAEQPPGRRSRLTLSRAWLQLDTVRNALEGRLEGVESRLDAALTALERVEKLNSEDVARARAILVHLDGQRSSFVRVSLPMRLELESSLQTAEGLLAQLQQEYEATRVIADRLVSGNFIDDMLGLLDAAGTRPERAAPEEPGPLPPESRPVILEAHSDNPRLNAWIDGYLREEGVTGAGLLDRDGRLVSGRLSVPPGEARVKLERMMADLDLLGSELGRGAPRLATVENDGSALIASRPLGTLRFLAVLDAPAALSRVLHRLRSELAEPEERASGGASLA